MKLNRARVNVNRWIEQVAKTFNPKYYLGVIHGCRRSSNLIKFLSASTNCGIHLVAIVGNIFALAFVSRHAEEAIAIDMYSATPVSFIPTYHQVLANTLLNSLNNLSPPQFSRLVTILYTIHRISHIIYHEPDGGRMIGFREILEVPESVFVDAESNNDLRSVWKSNRM